MAKKKKKKSSDGELTVKQKLFCHEYIKDKNATQAAIRAGYSKKTAQEQSSRLLSKVMVQEIINKHIEKVADKAEITAGFVLGGLKEVAQRCMQKVPVLEKDAEGNWVPTGEWKFDSSGANRSLELLGKNLKLFTDKIDLGGQIDNPVQLRDMSKMSDEELAEYIMELLH